MRLALLLLISFVAVAHAQSDSDQQQQGDPAFLGLRTAVYYVDDIEQAKNWYSEALGFKPYFDQPFYVGFNVGGYELGLSPAESETVKGTSPGIYWGVKDANQSLERLIKLGAKPGSPVQDVGDGILVATVVDPWGNTLGIIENRHFKLPAQD